MRKITGLSVLGAAVAAVAAVGIAACGSSAPAAHHHAAQPASQNTYVPPPPPAQPAAEANWEQNSPGYQSWIDVGSDFYQLGQDLDAGNYTAIYGVGGDGFKLAEAAAAALQNPSPVDRHAYKEAMANFGFAGVSLSNENVHDASKFAAKADRYLDEWATAAQPGATGASGCGNWNLSAQSNNC